jgi:CRISPR system Cascade subunit CasE
MYLSRLILNPHCRRVQNEVSRPYELHRTTMAAFPDDLLAGSERVLFRLEADSRSGRLTLLVQSEHAPNWAHLAGPGFAGYLLPCDAENPAVKHVDLRFAAGQILAFRLLANPTVKRAGSRVGLGRKEDQLAWLQRKASNAGFRVVTVDISDRGLVRQFLTENHPLSQAEASRSVTHLGVQFDGRLQVADPARLLKTIRDGVGSAKGFGYGLLSLASTPQ